MIGLLSPSLSRIMRESKLTRSVATIRQNAALLFTYTNEFKDLFPRCDEKPSIAAFRWYRPLIDAGYARQAVEFDPDFHRFEGRPSYPMSEAMVMDPTIMTKGKTLPRVLQRTSDVTLSQVTSPSLKGMLYQFYAPFDGRPPTIGEVGQSNVWCCGYLPSSPRVPVAMTDGSLTIGTWADFLPDGVLEPEDTIGYPVISTWGGVRGRDR